MVYKIALIGSPRVGKTSFVSSAVSGATIIPTQSLQIIEKKILFRGHSLTVHFYDKPGETSFNSVAEMDGVILMYDITRKDSYNALKEWLETQPPIPLIFIGNKEDLVGKRDISLENATTFCFHKQIPFFEISCTRNKQFQHCLSALLAQIIPQYPSRRVFRKNPYRKNNVMGGYVLLTPGKFQSFSSDKC